MSKTSIFYYTNNIAPPALFKYCLLNIIKLCRKNNSELIITSHYPITDLYTTIFHDIPISNVLSDNNPIYGYINDFCIKESEFKGINYINYVRGQLPYSYKSIIQQILLSEERCNGDIIILMEHDCLYPENYIKTIEDCFNKFDINMTYCSFNITFLNTNGYFNIDNGSFVLSTCAFKRQILKGIYSKKLELINSKQPYVFEPVLDIFSKYKKDRYKDETIINKHLCIDKFLENQCPLDIKHGLNTDGMIIGSDYKHFHPYWGEDAKYIEMIESAQITENNKKLWQYGIGKLNY